MITEMEAIKREFTKKMRTEYPEVYKRFLIDQAFHNDVWDFLYAIEKAVYAADNTDALTKDDKNKMRTTLINGWFIGRETES